jgi:ABC-type branched-subunit amino acid transport system substrate-binding protein
MLVADHQNKPDLAVGLVREWFDRGGVDMILGVDSSAVALGCTSVVAELDKVHLNSGAGTSALTGKACNANTIHWTQDTWCIPHSTATAVVKGGGEAWFFYHRRLHVWPQRSGRHHEVHSGCGRHGDRLRGVSLPRDTRLLGISA